jgi:hypothetical protein
LASFWQDQIFSITELKYMFRIALSNKIETCHPDDLATAIVNSIRKFDAVKNSTFIISGGPNARIRHRDRVAALMNVFGLPMPPASKFNESPSPMDWYDTWKSQGMLQYQTRTLSDTISDYEAALHKKYSPLFLPIMRCIVSPLLGKIIVNNL